MSLSAVSFGVACLFGQGGLSPDELKTWDRLAASCVTLEQGAIGATGSAVLIANDGRFLAHRSNVNSNVVSGRLRSGKLITLRLEFVDDPTQLVLLQADGWSESAMTPISVADPRSLAGRTVIAALATGPIRGEFVSSDRAGIMRPSLRYVPLSEIRFEATSQRIGGAMVFTYDGRLAGVMSATLEPMPSIGEINRTLQNTLNEVRRFGPQNMAVGYSLGVDVLQRVVEGFLSPSRRPEHPAIGAFFRDAAGQGALIDSVLPNSPASLSGLRPGDIVVRADSTTINDQFDLAVFLFKQKVGARIQLQVRRMAEQATLAITIGRQ
ncbi:MAG TPA: S1C family serine protease [Fimbriimonadaceae bacterium]|nr:S1C family serine protease [Fimbriimonadaceae bacterium]